jgi:[acyl-carrier-protein] S-malonyltransferase
MAAVINLPLEVVETLCRENSRDGLSVTISIENAPGQIVVSGNTAAVSAVIAAAGTREGGRAVLLPISVPCHSPLLKAAADRFAELLAKADFKDCSIPVIPNCDPSCLHSRELTRDLLFRQIICPVRWVQTIEKMAAMGVDTIVELGPKRVMSGLIRRINRKIRLLNVEDEESLEKTAATLNGEAEEQRPSPSPC